MGSRCARNPTYWTRLNLQAPKREIAGSDPRSSPFCKLQITIVERLLQLGVPPTTAYSRSRHRKESRQPYDYYKLLSTVSGDKANHPLSASECPQINVANE